MERSSHYSTTLLDSNCLFAVEITYVSANKEIFSPKLVVILFSSAISAYDMCTISNTLFSLAMNKPKVYLSMAIQNKTVEPFPMGSRRSILIAQFCKVQNFDKSEQATFFYVNNIKNVKVSSQSRNFECNVFSIIHLKYHNF